MKKKLKKGLVVVLAAMLALSCTGCWNYREIESLSVVTGMALDPGKNGYKYGVTFEILNPTGAQDKSSAQPLILESYGDTIFQAVRSALEPADHRLYFSNCKIAIVSSLLAEQGVKPLLDWFIRDGEPRITMNFFISKEKTAGEILSNEMASGELASYQISNMIGSSTENLGASPDIKLYEINNILNTEGVDLILPALNLQKSGKANTAHLDGTAVFNGDRLIGFLSDRDSQYLLFINDKIEGGILVTGKEPGAKDFSLEIQNSQTSVKPVVENGQVTVNLNVRMTAAFGEQTAKKDLVSKEGVLQIEKYAERTLRENIGRVIQKTQSEYDSDIFGFGSKIHQNSPAQWEKLSDRWNKLFPKIKYQVVTHVKISNTALVADRGGE